MFKWLKRKRAEVPQVPHVPHFEERILSFRIQDFETTHETNSQINVCWLEDFDRDLLQAGAMLIHLDVNENILVVSIYDKEVDEGDILNIINEYNFKYTEVERYTTG